MTAKLSADRTWLAGVVMNAVLSTEQGVKQFVITENPEQKLKRLGKLALLAADSVLEEQWKESTEVR